METFIIKTENIIAANIARKALKATDTSEIAHNLYKKACIGAKGGRIVITNIAEMQIWKEALKAYTPKNSTEGKIYRVLVARAVRGLEKRADNITALCREN